MVTYEEDDFYDNIWDVEIWHGWLQRLDYGCIVAVGWDYWLSHWICGKITHRETLKESVNDLSRFSLIWRGGGDNYNDDADDDGDGDGDDDYSNDTAQS